MKLWSPEGNRGVALGLTALFTATAVALSGCGAGASPSPSEATPKVGGSVEIAQAGDFQPNSILALRQGNIPWVGNVFESLTRLNEEGKPQPLLATDWAIAEDGRSITVNLRDDVSFHSGRKMTAEDVAWTFEKTKDPTSNSQVGFIAEQFSAIEVLSPTSLQITFANATNPATIFDYFEQTYILDQESFAGLADGSEVVGTGPYQWTAYRPGVSVELTRYDGHWDKESGSFLDKVSFQRVGDSTAQLSALRSGRAKIAFGLGLTDTQGFASDPQYQVMDSAGTIYPMGVDVTKEPFDDVRVRQAVQYAIDAERINQQVYADAGTVSDVFWGPSAPGITDEHRDRYNFDVDKAKELIEEAGATGAEVPITVITLPNIQSQYEIIANNLEAIGLKPSAVTVDETTFNSLQNQGNLGPAFLLLHGQVGFGETTMLNSLPSLRANNPSHFDSPEYQRLRQAFLTAQDEESEAALKELTDYMLDEAWSVPILQAPGKVVVAKDLQGVSTTKRGNLLFDQAFLAG